MSELTHADLDHARNVVYASMGPTPQYAWPLLSAEVGAEVWVKHETATPTGAFKVRGGLVCVERLRRERPEVRGSCRPREATTGRSIAFAGRANGIPVAIVVPRGNSPEKNAGRGGSGINALIAVGDLYGFATEVIGVDSNAAPATALSFEAGEVEATVAPTIVDGVACRRPDPASLAGMLAGARRFVSVSDDETDAAMRLCFRTTHQLPCPWHSQRCGPNATAGRARESG